MKFCNPRILLLSLVTGLMALSGCGQESVTTTALPTSNSVVAIDGSKYLLSGEPEDAAQVIKAREVTKDEDEIVIVGRIGGSKSPWTDGRAAFLIVDTSLKSCAEIGSDNCPTPWDYC
mgnify:CR=1 FL=1|jgi:hypothetical protein